MIVPAALQSLAFPWILVDSNGTLLQQGDGALFPKPEYEIEGVLSASASLSDGGWTVCTNGYALLRFTTTCIAPAHIVIHGLKIKGLSTATGRMLQLSITLTKEQILHYIQDYCAGLEAHDDQYKYLIRQNIHEVRGINSALYNSAFELEDLLSSQWNNAFIAKNIVQLSELLRGRIDFMEFIANPSAQNVRRGEIFVYRKFDKVQKCFSVTAGRRGINIQMLGTSTKTIVGPPVFDLVPYLLLDNALKYSPDNRQVKISVTEDFDQILCSVTSLGPRIDETELPRIFASGMRGSNALKSGKEGSGLGLSVLRKIVDDVFLGSVCVQQSSNKEIINSVPYCDVTFNITLPVKSIQSLRSQ